VLWWNWVNPESTRFMEIRLAELRVADATGAVAASNGSRYGQISANLKRAIVAAEDGKFLDHEGFDWEGIQNAIEKNQKKGRVVAGGSTISQQLAKNLFLSPAKTPLRKAEEAIITLMLEAVWSKQRILEVYLNVIEWGSGVFGAEAAARHYFGISASQLVGRAGGPPGGHGSAAALLRPQPQRSGAACEERDHPGANAFGGCSVSRAGDFRFKQPGFLQMATIRQSWDTIELRSPSREPFFGNQ
jgi:monofunctional biosynthetic peptidoglycan transglycosylase